MKRLTLLFFLFSTFVITSCDAVKWCNKHVPTTIRDSVVIKDSVAIRVDTTWFNYHVPADSIFLANRLYTVMDSLNKCHIQNTQGIVESNKIKIKYIIRNDSILIDAYTKPYEIKIAQLNTTIEHFKELYNSHYEKQSYTACKRPSWFSYWQSWLCIGVLSFLLIRFIFKKLGVKVSVLPFPPYIRFGS